MTSVPKNIAVVGGSLSGLFCALILVQQGCRVHVLERRNAEELEDQGGGLMLGKDVVDFLAGLEPDVGDEVTYLVRQTRRVTFGGDGEVIDSKDINVSSTSWGCLHRTLRKAFSRLAPATDSSFVEAASVTDIREHPTGSVIVEYRHNGSFQTLPVDLVVGADGASSRVGQIFKPETETKYSGYIVWRGLVPYSHLTGVVPDSLIYSRTWHFGDDYMVVGYAVPGQDNPAHTREDQVNWVWYHNTSEDQLGEVMTDVNGRQHAFTLTAGNVSESGVQKMHETARAKLPKDLSMLVQKTQQPFAQVIMDIFARQNTFLEGKIVLVGDAVGAMRPHVGTGTGQAIFHAMLLGELVKGSIEIHEFSKLAIRYSSILFEAGQKLGAICQHLPLTPVQKNQQFAAVQAEFLKELNEVQQQVPQMRH